MGLLFRLSAKYELLKVGYSNLLQAYYSDYLVAMNYWTLDMLIYYEPIILILWFVWLSDFSDSLICGLPDLSDSLIGRFSDLSDLQILLILLISANQQSEKHLSCYSGSLPLWPSVIQCLIQPAVLCTAYQHLSELQKVRFSVHQMYQVYRRSGIVPVQMYQVYRRSITMSIQINHFYSRSVIVFVQIYKRSVMTFVR